MSSDTSGFRMIDTLTKQVGNLSAMVLGLLVLLVVYDATMRYLFNAGSVALQELEWHLFDVVILLGIAYTLRENAHVRVDIFYDRFSEKRKAIINLIGTILFILPFSALIIYVGFEFVLLSFEQMERSSDPGGLPYRFIVKSLMPLAFVLLALQGISEIVRSYRIIKAAL
ncbi:MAG: TRAP transporter small permease subunit [Sulfurimonadaceae bacterium]|nr:TRAP transporter small permease subunit [Sulfurimonadaceae bacterium]